MVVASVQEDPPGTLFVLRPNRTLTWKRAGRIYAFVCTAVLGIGIGFYLLGMTLVLPFSGLEALALGIAVFLSLKNTEQQEVISITPCSVVVESGSSKPLSRREFKRYWVKVTVEAPSTPRYPSRLKLCSHGRELEIGSFLNEEDRRELARKLCVALAQ